MMGGRRPLVPKLPATGKARSPTVTSLVTGTQGRWTLTNAAGADSDADDVNGTSVEEVYILLV